MNLNEFINLGIKLEETVSTCYECLEGLSSDQTVSPADEVPKNKPHHF
jgi:hypothetical protein